MSIIKVTLSCQHDIYLVEGGIIDNDATRAGVCYACRCKKPIKIVPQSVIDELARKRGSGE